ncbi:uncharacterized protein LOC134528591 [Bacillus rossius redtenbacheri]|uniref:uncharacterized protein LOC134528591 n=1 Tax=Bacillus rossius redtenbacheri TaxID=93214 RepID=UPI002FDD4EF2
MPKKTPFSKIRKRTKRSKCIRRLKEKYKEFVNAGFNSVERTSSSLTDYAPAAATQMETSAYVPPVCQGDHDTTSGNVQNITDEDISGLDCSFLPSEEVSNVEILPNETAETVTMKEKIVQGRRFVNMSHMLNQLTSLATHVLQCTTATSLINA